MIVCNGLAWPAIQGIFISCQEFQGECSLHATLNQFTD